MRKHVAVGLIAVMLVLPAIALAQARSTTSVAQAAPGSSAAQEIKVDEPTALKVAALEARMSAVLANFALLQRQAQDLQQEMSKLIDERKTLVQEAAKRASVDVKDPNEWLFDNKGQKFVRNPRPAGATPAPANTPAR
jgi:hypothetical protein